MQRSLYIIIGLILLAAPLAAQDHPAAYRGSRPASRSELNALETRVEADSARTDSVATASAAKDTLLDARIDSVRDNVSGGGGGVIWWDLSIGPAADGAGYDFEVTDLTDSTEFTDSLNIAIDSLSALGVLDDNGIAYLYVAPGHYIIQDTVFAPLIADGYNRLVISGTLGVETAARFEFVMNTDLTPTVLANTGKFRGSTALNSSWRNVTFQWLHCYGPNYRGSIMAIDTLAAFNTDSIRFEHCLFEDFQERYNSTQPIAFFSTLTSAAWNIAVWNYPGTGVGVEFNDCTFRDFWSCRSVFLDMTFNRCIVEGKVNQFFTMAFDGSNAVNSTRLTVRDCTCRSTGAWTTQYYDLFWIDDAQRFYVSNTDFIGWGNGYYGQFGIIGTGGRASFESCRFLFRGGPIAGAFNVQSSAYVDYSNCLFEHFKVFLGVNSSMMGCMVRDSSYVHSISSSNMISNNRFYGNATYGIYIAGGSNTVVMNNAGRGTFGTWINDAGTSTITANNYDD